MPSTDAERKTHLSGQIILKRHFVALPPAVFVESEVLPSVKDLSCQKSPPTVIHSCMQMMKGCSGITLPQMSVFGDDFATEMIVKVQVYTEQNQLSSLVAQCLRFPTT